MTRKQMEAKIEELAAELKALKEQKLGCCGGHGCTCMHWHYTYWHYTQQPYTLPYQYTTTTTGTGYNYQIANQS